MRIVADLHIHSKYSRATSKNMDLEHLAEFAKLKGINLLGTGDFTHFLWLEELRTKLKPVSYGLFEFGGINFILTTEVSNIYSQNGRLRRIHNMLFAPSFEVVEKINHGLSGYGTLSSDGRPMLGLSSQNLVEIVLGASKDCFIVPSHCLLPDTLIHTKDGLKRIKDMLKGDLVYTHKLNYKKVTKVLRRSYKGKIYHIRPYYFREGLRTTVEHPFYVIKTYKDCRWIGGICRPNCSKVNNCRRKYFQKYQPAWFPAEDVESGDIILFPRFKDEVKDIEELKISDFLKEEDYLLNHDEIFPRGYKVTKLNNTVKINKDFCRLAGYFISEGYTNGRDCISFSFNTKEINYIEDVKNLMKNIFNFSSPKTQVKKLAKGIELIYYSKVLIKLFSKIFYLDGFDKRAYSKCLPNWMLILPLEKQAEVIKGWWRGDTGYTSSRILMNQIKILLLRLGIIPSIRMDSKEEFKKRGKHKIGKRTINIRYDSFQFSNLSFFKDPHNLLMDDCFKKFKTKLKRRHGWMDERYIYLPVRDIQIIDYEGEVYNLEVDENNSYISEFAIVHNCWTPWFGLFGSESGFDKIEECFGKYAKDIYALETGLSSDPAMNWRLSALDRFSLISNSDSHSPSRIGREANVFEAKLDYLELLDILKKKDKKRFLFTVEFFPQEGKYHYDGHRNCNVRLSPKETIELKGNCPKCGRRLTVGVMHRVEKLADREEGFKPDNAIEFKNMVTLDEIIASAKGMGVATQAVEQEYLNIIGRLGNEFDILLNLPEKELRENLSSKIAEGIIRVRQGKLNILPGYDGEYGKMEIFGKDETEKKEKQMTLF